MKVTAIALIALLACFTLLFRHVDADFGADFVLSGSIANAGRMKGRIEYSWASRAFRLKFQGPDQFTQEYNYNPSYGRESHYQQYLYELAPGSDICGKCQVNAIRGQMPPLEHLPTTGWKLGAKVTNPEDNRECTLYLADPQPSLNASRNEPVSVGFDTNNLPCNMEFADKRKFFFTNVVINRANYTFETPTDCVCKKRLDLTLVLDGSSSINANEWNIINKFVRDIAATFEISSEAASISITEYWAEAKNLLPITDDKAVVDAYLAATLPRFGSGTNVIAALNIVKDDVFLKRRAGAIPVIITLTDGADRSNAATIGAKIDEFKAIGVQNFISIFVGDTPANTQAQMLALAGGDPQRTFHYQDFEKFGKAIKEINAAACDADIKEGGDCGTGCCGFCACATCISPLECDDHLACTINEIADVPGTNLKCCKAPEQKKCTPSTLCNESKCVEPTGQCVESPKDCTEKDKCFTYSCDPARGCVRQPVCTTDNRCLEVSCQDGVCSFANKTCPPDDPCTKYHCVDGNCVATPVNCDDGKPCTRDYCNVSVGCVHEDIVPCVCTDCPPSTICDDIVCIEGFCTPVTKCNITNDKCFTYTGNCDLTNGCEKISKCDDKDPCTIDTCDPLTGACSHTPVNCDDGNACTDDSCDAATGKCINVRKNCTPSSACHTATCDDRLGCVETPLPEGHCDDFNTCTEDYCDPTLGCQHKNVTCDDGLICTVDSCHPIKGCLSSPMRCPDADECYLGTCENGTCTTFKGTLCDEEKIIIGLSTGAIVGIIIAAIVAAVLLGAGAYKGYQAFNASKELDQAGNVNPLYEAGGTYGENKLFGDYQAFK